MVYVRIIIILLLAAGWGRAAETPARLAELERAGQWRQAAGELRALLGKPEQTPAARAALTARLARALRLGGKPELGLKELEQLDPELQDRTEIRCERGRCLAAMGAREQALAALDLCRQASDLRWRCLANVAAGQVTFDLGRYEACVSLLEQVQKDQAVFSRAEIDGDKELREALQTVPPLLEKARDALLRAKYGEDYARYRHARQAEAWGTYAVAAGLYAGIRSPLLADAAGCYRAACLARTGDPKAGKTALAAYEAFLAADPDGLYREEAQLELALLLAREAVSIKDWQGIVARSQDMLRFLARLESEPELRDPAKVLAHATSRLGQSVSEAEKKRLQLVLTDFPGVLEFTRRDDMGNLVRQWSAPETVVNRLTCPWYLDFLQVRGEFMLAYASMRAGDVPGAHAALADLEAFNRRRGGRLLGRSGVIPRLHESVDSGGFLLPPEVWDKLDGPLAERVRMGFFFYLSGEDALAARLFGEVQPAGEGPEPQRRRASLTTDAAECGVACCEFRDGKIRAAASRLKTVLASRKTGPLAAFAKILLANWTAAEPGQAERVFALYREAAAERSAGKAVIARAWLSLAVCAVNQQRPTVTAEACMQLQRQYPGSPWAMAAATILTLSPGGKTGGAGRILEVEKHLIVPGGCDLADGRDDLAAGDLLRYRVTAAPRSACVVIRQFQLHLSEMEPQPPPATGRETSFVRAPLLYAGTLPGR